MTKNTIIPVLAQKLPEFVRDNYPNFVRFIKDYLSFLEQDGNFLQIIEDWRLNNEPSLEVEPYVTAMLKSMGFESQQQLLVRKSLLAHTLRDFYLSRGSIESFKYLFRALFNEDVDIQYPREQMLIPSAAAYGSRHFIFTSANQRLSVDFQQILDSIVNFGGTATGNKSGTKADIENISIIYGSGVPYLQIEILEPINEFRVDDLITISSNGNSVVESIKPVLEIKVSAGGSNYSQTDSVVIIGSKIQGAAKLGKLQSGGITSLSVSNGGTGYSVGDRIFASSSDDGFGFGATVKTVDVSGSITSVSITSRGYNYSSIPTLGIRGAGAGAVLGASSTEIGALRTVDIVDPFVDFSSVTVQVNSTSGSGASFTTNKKTRWTTKAWENRRGFLEENSTLIDSNKYQQYSYTIISSVPASEYNDFVQELLHPVGYIRSSSFEITSDVYLGTTPDYSINDKNVVFAFDHASSFSWSSTFDLSTQDTPYIVAVLPGDVTDPIITDNGDQIIATL